MTLADIETGEVVEQSNLTEVAPDEIVVTDRHRRDLGDLGPLAESVRDLGMLQPIVCRLVEGQLWLVAGERRLAVARKLGMSSVSVVVAENLDSAALALAAERDENQCRKAMTAVELKSLTDALLEIEREAAAERRREGAARGGRAEGVAPENHSLKGPKNRAAAAAASAVGWSRASYERVKRVEEAADDDSLPEAVRELATKELEKLANNETSPVAADRAVKDAKVDAGVATTAEKVDKAKRDNPPPKTAKATEQRLAEYPDLCARGYTSRQIAERWGIERESLWDFSKRHGLAPPPADAVVGKTRRHDSNRIVNETVASLEGICIGIDLIDADDLDREQYDYWVSSLSASLKSITTLRNLLKKELTR